MYGETPLIVHKRLVTNFVPLYPVAYLLSQFPVIRVRTIELIGKSAKEAVAVAQRRGGVKTQRTQLLCQELVVLRRVESCLQKNYFQRAVLTKERGRKRAHLAPTPRRS